MELRIEQLAAEVGMPVSTIRYYYHRGLLSPPKKRGRVAFYGAEHLAGLKEIQRLSDLGLSLAQLNSFLNGTGSDPILDKLVVAPPLSQKALVEKSGVSSEIASLAIKSGLIKSIPGSNNRYYADAAEMLSAANDLINAGVGLEELLSLAITHQTNVEKTAKKAVAIFASSIKKRTQGLPELTRQELSDEIEELLTDTVQLVTTHFRQTLLAAAAEYVSATSTKKILKKAPVKSLQKQSRS